MPLSRRHFFLGSLALPALAAPKTAGERPFAGVSQVLPRADTGPRAIQSRSAFVTA
jgi:hypothetical protein